MAGWGSSPVPGVESWTFQPVVFAEERWPRSSPRDTRSPSMGKPDSGPSTKVERGWASGHRQERKLPEECCPYKAEMRVRIPSGVPKSFRKGLSSLSSRLRLDEDDLGERRRRREKLLRQREGGE